MRWNLMTENHVTGLPVMDGKSRCIGLITASDILGFEEEHAEESSDDGMLQHFNPEIQPWESVPISAFGLEEFGDVRVEEVMTRDLIIGRSRYAAQERSRRRCSSTTFTAYW